MKTAKGVLALFSARTQTSQASPSATMSDDELINCRLHDAGDTYAARLLEDCVTKEREQTARFMPLDGKGGGDV